MSPSTSKRDPSRGRRNARGFSLVEVMVAMVIGMLGIIVMMQMFRVFEGQRRTTTAGDDAISAGSVTLFGLQRDLQQSGWGFGAVNLIGCNVTGLTAGGGAIPLSPVTINPAAITGQDVNTDTLLIVSGNGNGVIEGAQFLAPAAANATSYTVAAPVAFADPDTGDTNAVRVVVAPQTRLAGACNLTVTTIAAQPTATSVTVSVSGGIATAIATGDRLFMLGDRPTVRAYAIRNGNLTVCDWVANNCAAVANNTNTAIWVPVANNVVSLRAQYGRDTTAGDMDGVPEVWDRTTPTTATPISTVGSKNIEACAVARRVAVRVALVARSSQPERTFDWPALTAHVTPAAPEWAGSDAVAQAISATEAGNVAISLPDPDPTWPTWQDFRYKVFQTVVPLRNVRNITSPGVVSEC